MIQCTVSDLQQRCLERGYTLEQVSQCISSKDGDVLIVDEMHEAYPRRSRLLASEITPCLPGTELHALLRDWLGIEPTPTCPCRSMAAKMDRLGPDWCESDEGMGEILGVMRTEHEKRRSEGTTILPWTDFGARQLVLLACRRARDKAAG